jgi:hypothetical protein
VGSVLGAVVFSHWLLDLPMHRHDMPILPRDAGGLPLLGFGLWQLPVASAALELALVIGGTFLYWRAAKRVAEPAGDQALRRANVTSAVMLATGLATLLLNAMGM